MSRAIVFIDGFNLYFGLKSKQWRRYYWLDLYRMAQNILRPGRTLVAVNYFTARISAHPDNPEKQKRQAIFLDAVETLPDTRIYYGHYLRKQIRCGQCGNVWDAPEEKMTDVNISVEMMRDAFDDIFDMAFLISGDSDLAAPIETIRQRYPEKRIIVVFPPNRHSRRLQSLATGDIRLGEDILRKSKLPGSYTRPDGVVLHRPEKWK